MVNSIISKILNQEITNFKNFEVTWPHRFNPRNLQGVLWEERYFIIYFGGIFYEKI